MAPKRVVVKDLKVGDVVRWSGPLGTCEGPIHNITPETSGLFTIRLAPLGSATGNFRADDKVDVLNR